MGKSVVGFVAQNANGILEWWTREILEKLDHAGYETYFVDLLKPDFSTKLATALNERDTAFGFGFQGMGSDILAEGKNLWDSLGIPFFSCMGDSPYINPRKHLVAARRVYLLYLCRDFYDTYVQYLSGSQMAVLARPALPANPHAAEKRWSDRDIDLIYVKSGVDPDGYLKSWANYPKMLRSIACDAADVALAGSQDTIADICAARFAAEGLHYGDRLEMFCSIAFQVDHYVRARRAARLAAVLLKLPVRIYGDWDFLDKTGCRATFHGSVPAGDLPHLYANSRIVANISPSVRYGIHERIIAGFMSKCAVLSDITPISRTVLSDYPAFFGFDIDSPDFQEQILSQLHLPRDIEDRTEASFEAACSAFSLDRFVEVLTDMVQLDAYAQASLFYSVDPRSRMPSASRPTIVA